MGRLIDADKFILAIMDASLSSVDEDTILDLIDSVPTVDAVPVVRCVVCQWAKPKNKKFFVLGVRGGERQYMLGMQGQPARADPFISSSFPNNKSNESDWDFDLLADELPGLDLSAFDFDWGLPEDTTDEVTEDEAPEVDEESEPITKLGDIWQLGRHRLMCGDSTSVECVQKLMGGAQADLLLTDPPYGVDYTGKTKDALKIENDAKSDDEFIAFLQAAFEAANSVMKPGAVFYIWHADSKAYVFRTACQMTGWEVRQVLIWVKNAMVMGRQDYQWKHEPCLYGWKAGAGHLWASDRKQTTVLEFDRPTANKEHPTMKPVALFDYQIKNNTKGGDIVLDLFAGSGTTVAACEQNGRNAYVMEFDPKYCDVIVKRWENLTGKKAVLLHDD